MEIFNDEKEHTKREIWISISSMVTQNMFDNLVQPLARHFLQLYNEKSVKTRAGFSEGYGNIGFLQLQKGNIDEAIKALQKAISFNSNFVQAYTTLANAYLMKGLVEESIQANLKVLSLEPTFAIAHNNLVIGYLEKGEHQKAIEHCDKAIEYGYDVAPKIIEEIDSYR